MCEEQRHWRELAHLYAAYDEYDNAATCMMGHPTVAWDHVAFKDVIAKVSNADLYYKALAFYLQARDLAWLLGFLGGALAFGLLWGGCGVVGARGGERGAEKGGRGGARRALPPPLHTHPQPP